MFCTRAYNTSSFRGENGYTNKKPSPRRPITDILTRLGIWSFQINTAGKMAKTQSVKMETAATRKESAVWISRGWHVPGRSVCQFFLADGKKGSFFSNGMTDSS